MEIRELTVTPREGVGKSVARRLRRSGKTPGILYGGSTPVNIAVDPREVFRIIHGHEGRTPLACASPGPRPRAMFLLPALQPDPAPEDLVHVAPQEVNMDKPIQVTVA